MISMNKMKTLFRRLKFKLRHDFFTAPNIVLVFAVSLGLVWTFQSVMAMTRNWELSEKLTAEKKELELLTIELEASQLENDYYKTEEYQELIARKNLDKKMPGENMVVMPENSNEAKERYQIAGAESIKTEYSNFDQWMMFLFPKF